MSLVLNGTTRVSKVQDGVVTASDLSGNQTGDAPIYGCRAWVNFDGTRNVTDTGASTNGQPVKIRASGNVTSVTKNATGDYTINFNVAMIDNNYADVITTTGEATTSTKRTATVKGTTTGGATLKTTTQLAITTGATDAIALLDMALINVAIFR